MPLHPHSFILVAAVVLLCAPSTCVALPSGLVSWYMGENSPADAEGANPGTVQGSLTYSGGAVGQGFSLSGSGYVSVANPTLNTYTSAFTVAGWFVMDSYTGNASFFNFRNGTNNSGLDVEQDSGSPGTLHFDVAKSGGSGTFARLNSVGWLLNTPYFVAATFDGATGVMSIYRDGGLIATRTDSPDAMAAVSGPSLNIGRNLITGELWKGKIDEVQFYGRALNQAEVASIAIPEPGSISLLALGLVGYMGFGRGRGSGVPRRRGVPKRFTDGEETGSHLPVSLF